MPVHLDTHDPEIDLTPGTAKSDILAFLYRSPEFGYRPTEIRDLLDVPHGTATTTLKRLYDDGFVGKTEDSYYHALDHREDLQRYVASLDQVDRMFGERQGAGIDQSSPNPVDEEALDAEVADLEAELDE